MAASKIASSSTMVAAALSKFESKCLAPGSTKAREARLTTWCKVVGAFAEDPLDLNPDLILKAMAVFDEAGYRSTL